MLRFLETTVQTLEEPTSTLADIFTDPEVDITKPKETLGYFAKLWAEWNLWGKFVDALPQIIAAVVIVIIGFVLAHIVSKILVRAMRRKRADYAVYNFIAKMIRFVIRITFLLIAVSMFIKINSIIAALSAVGVAVGLGLQDSVAQFVSGVQILINHPFRAGDFIEVNGVSGNVVEIGFMTTIIRSLDNKRIVLPNSDLTKHHITNCSVEGKRRLDFSFSISYGDDLAKAKQVLTDTVIATEHVLTEPAPTIAIGEHGASGVEIKALVWCNSAHYWDVYFALFERVKLAFDANGITIPFNQLDVHVIDTPKN